jgi:multimeric flavodoxin WrbA
MTLRALAFNCTLKKSPEKSSTEKLLQQFLNALAAMDVRGEMVRAVDYNIKPGVSSDEGEGDAWPSLRERALAADIIVIGSPIWLGQPSSVAKRILERMDAFLSEKDKLGRMPSYGKVAVVNVVGNEDGAHHVAAEVLQALSEVGFSVPPGGVAYWVGEAMGSVNYVDLKKTPDALADWITMLAANTAHLAGILKSNPFPGRPGTSTG